MNNVSYKQLAIVNLNGVEMSFEERPFVVVVGDLPKLAENVALGASVADPEATSLQDPIVVAVEMWCAAKTGSVGKTRTTDDLANELGLSLRCVMDESEIECLLVGLKGEAIK